LSGENKENMDWQGAPIGAAAASAAVARNETWDIDVAKEHVVKVDGIPCDIVEKVR
jgi:hypothetical protein